MADSGNSEMVERLHARRVQTPAMVATKPIAAFTEKDVERFWASVEKGGQDQCWSWKGGVTKNRRGVAYGVVWHFGNRKTLKAHRVAYTLAHGAIPNGMVVRHNCDNSICVNPAHLQFGTQLDNVRDREERGRGSYLRGEKHQNAKVTNAQAADIIALLASGVPQRTIAKNYGISQFGVRYIRDNWQVRNG